MRRSRVVISLPNVPIVNGAVFGPETIPFRGATGAGWGDGRDHGGVLSAAAQGPDMRGGVTALQGPGVGTGRAGRVEHGCTARRLRARSGRSRYYQPTACAEVAQQLDGAVVVAPAPTRHRQRCVPVAVHGIQVGAAVDQQLDDGVEASRGSGVQRRVTRRVRGVDVHPRVDRHRGRFQHKPLVLGRVRGQSRFSPAAGGCRRHQRRRAVLHDDPRIGSTVGQRPHDSRFGEVRGQPEGGGADHVVVQHVIGTVAPALAAADHRRIRVRSAREQRRRQRLVAAQRGGVQRGVAGLGRVRVRALLEQEEGERGVAAVRRDDQCARARRRHCRSRRRRPPRDAWRLRGCLAGPRTGSACCRPARCRSPRSG